MRWFYLFKVQTFKHQKLLLEKQQLGAGCSHSHTTQTSLGEPFSHGITEKEGLIKRLRLSGVCHPPPLEGRTGRHGRRDGGSSRGGALQLSSAAHKTQGSSQPQAPRAAKKHPAEAPYRRRPAGTGRGEATFPRGAGAECVLAKGTWLLGPTEHTHSSPTHQLGTPRLSGSSTSRRGSEPLSFIKAVPLGGEGKEECRTRDEFWCS